MRRRATPALALAAAWASELRTDTWSSASSSLDGSFVTSPAAAWRIRRVTTFDIDLATSVGASPARSHRSRRILTGSGGSSSERSASSTRSELRRSSSFNAIVSPRGVLTSLDSLYWTAYIPAE